MKKCLIILFSCFLFVSGCKNPTSSNPTQSFSFTFHNMKPNRPGEVYAMWVEIPKSGVPGTEKPQHGLVISKLISTFTVNQAGEVIGFDTTGLSARIGIDYALVIRAEVSVERQDSIGLSPAAYYLVGTIGGTTNIGTATTTVTDPLAFGTALSPIAGIATLASNIKTPNNYKGEVYFMDLTNPADTAPGLSNLSPLPSPWQFGVWTVDSAMTPPVWSFLGYVITSDAKDTKSTHDSYNFPGGKSPNDSASTLLDLTTGKSSVLLTLEPAVSPKDPTVPFSATVLQGTIPTSQPAFTSFSVQNVATGFPSVDVKIAR